MFVPHSFGLALLMILTSAICWGSWANTFKGVKNYRFELFYWDYALGIFLIAVALAFTMGNTSNDASSFLNNIRAADRSNYIYTLAGGAVFKSSPCGRNRPGRSGHRLSGFDRHCHGGRRRFELFVAAERECAVARSRCRMRRHRGGPRWQGLWKPHQSCPASFSQEHHHLPRFRNSDGPLGSIYHSRDDPRKRFGSL